MTTETTPATIRDTLLQAADLSREGPLSAMYAYRRAKSKTGCPVDLEEEIIQIARQCQETADELRTYLTRAAKEAADGLASLDAYGTRVSRTWFYLDTRETAERLNKRLTEQRSRFDELLRVWAAVADRIVATPEETAAAEQSRREALMARWQREDFERVKVAALQHNIAGRSKAAIAEGLAALGVEP